MAEKKKAENNAGGAPSVTAFRRGRGQGVLAELLAPVAALAVLASAMVRAAVDRSARRGGAGATSDSYRPPGAAIEDKKVEARERGGLRAKLDRVGQRIPPLGRLLEVQQRYSELRGNNVAAAVTFEAFVSLLPLLLVIVSVVGLVAANSDVDVAGRIIANLGLTGDAAETIRNAVESASESHSVAGPIGMLGLLWTGLGLVNALQYALNQVWQVEERGIKDKAVGVGWLMGAAVIFVGASALTTVLRWLPGAFAPLGIAVGLGVNFLLWLWTFRILPNAEVGWKPLVPGAIAGAVGMEASRWSEASMFRGR